MSLIELLIVATTHYQDKNQAYALLGIHYVCEKNTGLINLGRLDTYAEQESDAVQEPFDFFKMSYWASQNR